MGRCRDARDPSRRPRLRTMNGPSPVRDDRLDPEALHVTAELGAAPAELTLLRAGG